MGEINWLTELRKIEREFDGLPPDWSSEHAMRRSSAPRGFAKATRCEERQDLTRINTDYADGVDLSRRH